MSLAAVLLALQVTLLNGGPVTAVPAPNQTLETPAAPIVSTEGSLATGSTASAEASPGALATAAGAVYHFGQGVYNKTDKLLAGVQSLCDKADAIVDPMVIKAVTDPAGSLSDAKSGWQKLTSGAESIASHPGESLSEAGSAIKSTAGSVLSAAVEGIKTDAAAIVSGDAELAGEGALDLAANFVGDGVGELTKASELVKGAEVVANATEKVVADSGEKALATAGGDAALSASKPVDVLSPAYQDGKRMTGETLASSTPVYRVQAPGLPLVPHASPFFDPFNYGLPYAPPGSSGWEAMYVSTNKQALTDLRAGQTGYFDQGAQLQSSTLGAVVAQSGPGTMVFQDSTFNSSVLGADTGGYIIVRPAAPLAK